MKIQPSTNLRKTHSKTASKAHLKFGVHLVLSLLSAIYPLGLDQFNEDNNFNLR